MMKRMLLGAASAVLLGASLAPAAMADSPAPHGGPNDVAPKEQKVFVANYDDEKQCHTDGNNFVLSGYQGAKSYTCEYYTWTAPGPPGSWCPPPGNEDGCLGNYWHLYLVTA